MNDIEAMKIQLLKAGWERQSAHVWRSPLGNLYRGPYGAWKVMTGQNRYGTEKRVSA